MKALTILDYPAHPHPHPQPGDRVAIHAAVRPVRFLEIANLFGNLGTRADASMHPHSPDGP